ncbi:hypothetical protein BJX68DRAFT_226018 [Aspergillus pseudodeflectus]|uniref:Zn(2)-C6 fungal-type domain-containing protein n=1 Tax=Aspergillus pseudodeflectus TaxID=176178 RepID=A0ABR4L4X3_9EURO
MVYFGPSRGCLTCKKRRKKCDETRPSCLRCLNTNRVCRGYEAHANGNLIFRQHEHQSSAQPPRPLPFNSMARKCSLPVRVPAPGSSSLPPDILPKEVPRDVMGECALRAFFYDFCIVPINPTLSRGFLGGLERMVHRSGLQSQVAKACMAVGYASHGVKLFRPFFVQEAEELYHELLSALAQAIRDPGAIDKEQTVVMAILLGLYEMIMARDTAPGNHAAHAGGLAALLRIENDPLSLLEAVCSGQSLLPNALRGQGMFSTVCSLGRGKDLDTLLLRLQSICRGSETILSQPSLHGTEQLRILLAEASALNTDIAQWQQAQSDKFKPTTAGHIKPDYTSRQFRPGVGSWPGRVDVYFDMSFAAIWNISRTARCFLLDLIIRISEILEPEASDRARYTRDLINLLCDIVASIPYFLTEDVQAFLRQDATHDISNPGRAAGGLLLMHELYALSQLPTVFPEMQEYFKRCLGWIGERMGIGQASLFAKDADIGKEYVTSGCVIIWAALLV